MGRRKICLVTTSRSDFGLLQELLLCIKRDPSLRLQVAVTGSHLAPSFGSTVREVEAAGLKIDRRIDLQLAGGSALNNAEAIGRGVTGFARAFGDLKPEIVVLLGDRFELFAPAIAALMFRIPIAHIHGGERSDGAMDDSIRHSITKLASLHFAATEIYRRRIIQMGESPRYVFNFGAPGLDQLFRQPLMTKPELELDLQFRLDEPIAMVTYHPETHDTTNVRSQIKTVLAALEKSGLRAVFTMANADAHGNVINGSVQKLCASDPERFKWAPNLGHRRYLSCLKHFSLMVGNSSSGLTEAPSFRLPVVNIGDRQGGRVRARNVIDVPRNEIAIQKGIKWALSSRFRATLRGMRNPYDRFHDGRVSERIVEVLRNVELHGDLVKKQFNDLDRAYAADLCLGESCQTCR